MGQWGGGRGGGQLEEVASSEGPWRAGSGPRAGEAWPAQALRAPPGRQAFKGLKGVYASLIANVC